MVQAIHIEMSKTSISQFNGRPFPSLLCRQQVLSLRKQHPRILLRLKRLEATKESEITLNEEEFNLFSSYKAEVAGSQVNAVESSHELLLEALNLRKVQPDRVLGAMLFLEDNRRNNPSNADLLPRLQGAWRLVFSGPSKLKFLSYIPVDEDFLVDLRDSSLKLESDLGPMRAKFKGSFQWRAANNEMDFSFTRAEVDLFGRPVWSKDVAFKPKTYSYFWMRDDVACARSSGGTLTLMKRLAA